MKYDKKRYLFIIKGRGLNGGSLLFYYKKLFGDFEALQASIKIVHEKDDWLVLRVNHKYLTRVRAAILVYGSGSLYTMLVSGSIRALIRKLQLRSEGKKYAQDLLKAYLEEKRGKSRA